MPERRTRLPRRRQLLAGLALGSLVTPALVGGCASPRLRLGLLASLSGRLAESGIEARNGAQLAIHMLGADAAVPIELTVVDDGATPDTALSAWDGLVAAGVDAVIGPMTSAIALAIVVQRPGSKTPLISPAATSIELSQREDFFFRVVPDSATLARRQAQLVYRRGGRRLAVVYDLSNQRGRDYARSWPSLGARAFEHAGGEVVLELGFDAGAGAGSAELVTAIGRSGADAALLVASTIDVANLCQRLRLAGLPLLITTSTLASTPQLPQLGGAAVEGVLVPRLADSASTAPAYLAFAERFRGRHGRDPGYVAVRSYEAVALARQAWQQRRWNQTLLEALRATSRLDGLQQPIEFDRYGDATTQGMFAEIRDGRYRSVGDA